MLVTAAAGAVGLATVDLAKNVIGAKVCCHIYVRENGLYTVFMQPS